ncbi:MAG: T9SS type A sorting domain-containing protein, partial [Bacteroidota bacterium]|nr:T9SS type A sorting domain-containing protein [Bacteroidota bacterium]
FSGGGRAGIFSSTPGLVFINNATGEVNLAASTSGNYIVTNTIAASGGCGVVTATSPIDISGLIWTGASGTDWNVTGNWSCGFVPYLTTVVQIPDVTNKPVLSTGATGTVNNLTINPGSSLTISGNTIQIAGAITNNGTFTATDGTVELNGASAQSIGSSVFSSNTIKNLTINNSSGVSLLGPLSVTGIVNVQSGTLSSGGNLTLASTASGTALINGSGAGSVTGNVTMQRYLPSGFGYKYFSSPFQSATVNEFGDDMDLTYWFPTFYSFDENSVNSGWIDYTNTSGTLDPLHGYAVNFGSDPAAKTIDVTGVVNNGSQSATFYNHNNTYTLGFNLAGNPYPSPIDWDAASGWTKTNIDDAIYYFKASTTDEYGGTYSSYVNKTSSDGLATATIPSMQGFFIHVSDGTYPVTGTLAMDNNVRITDLTHAFLKSDEKGTIQFIRLSATSENDTTASDPLVVYFDEKASAFFDGNLDALKLMNSDYFVPNFYTIGIDGKKMSIDARPAGTSSDAHIKLGLDLNLDGYIIFRINNISTDLSCDKVSITDLASGKEQDLLHGGVYRVFLTAGEYQDRFVLNLSETATVIPETGTGNDLFSVYATHRIIKMQLNLDGKTSGNHLTITNLTGQIMIIKKNLQTGYQEFDSGLKDGFYIVTFTSGNYSVSRKILIKNL